jgi:hypothetical protein
MHPYKIVRIVCAQELSESDCETCTTLYQDHLQNVPRTAVSLFTDERHIFTFQAQSTKKISGTGLTITLGNFTGHSTALRLLCGVAFFSLVCGVHRGRCYCNGDLRSVLCNA